jgi:hypothetical protein
MAWQDLAAADDEDRFALEILPSRRLRFSTVGARSRMSSVAAEISPPARSCSHRPRSDAVGDDKDHDEVEDRHLADSRRPASRSAMTRKR